jgi:hypothetical protein
MRSARRTPLALLLLALLLAGLAACGGNGGHGGNGGNGGNGGGGLLPQTNLMQALSYAPTNTDSLAFTDWTLIKRYAGAQNLTGQSPLSDRLRFLNATRLYAISAAFAAGYEQEQMDVWSWDTTDLLWEAELDSSRVAPVYVLRFRSDFDFSPVVAHFTANGFSNSAYQGATIYSHRLDVTAVWFLEPGDANAAILPSAHMMIWSGQPDGIQSALDAHASSSSSLASDAGFRGVAAQMGAPASAILSTAMYVCHYFGSSLLAPGVSQGKAAAGVSSVHQYAVLGLEYQQMQGQTAELIDLHYASSLDAQADLTARKALATNGLSLADHQAYSQSFFTVTSASVSGSDVTLHVTPLNNNPQALFDMFYQFDMLFAVCA